MRSAQDRFWSKVDKQGPIHDVLGTPCWIWIGATQADGYGRFRFNGKIVVAHRLAWFFKYGRWPEPCGLHKCDNPPCCNPGHLFEGTLQENAIDCITKERSNKPQGEEHWSVKLNDADVREIRRKYATGNYRQVALAKYYGISQSRVSLIIRGKGWKHLE